MELRSNLFLIRTTPSSLHDSEMFKRYEAKRGMLLRNIEGSGEYTEKEVDQVHHVQPNRKKDLYREDKQVM